MKYSNVEDFLKRIVSYKKFFSQFSAKTFTVNTNPNYLFEIEIKSLICDIFDYILGLRDDFLLDNFYRFLTRSYTRHSTSSNFSSKSDLKRLFPKPVLKVSHDSKSKLNKKQSFLEEDLYNLDTILEKPLLETLLIALYLSQNSEVQQKIMGLIFKATTLSKRFFSNIQKLELLTTFQEKRMFIKINKYIDRLKISNFTTQASIFF